VSWVAEQKGGNLHMGALPPKNFHGLIVIVHVIVGPVRSVAPRRLPPYTAQQMLVRQCGGDWKRAAAMERPTSCGTAWSRPGSPGAPRPRIACAPAQQIHGVLSNPRRWTVPQSFQPLCHVEIRQLHISCDGGFGLAVYWRPGSSPRPGSAPQVGDCTPCSSISSIK
jgi:hypothetical protein